MKNNNKTVFVGVSGGVDSSVAALLLKNQGYCVIGVFIRTWSPDFIECIWKDERRDAMRVCAHLDIPFLECDAEEAYKKGVADYMIREYKEGRTPNPDVMCNREVKFGVFWDFAKKHGADFIATGHYAINKKEKNFTLKCSSDDSKDQVYFLWTLNQEDLSHTLFPVGHLKKSEVRKLAEKYKLPTSTKKDSQGVCFLGPLDMKDFLKHYIEEKEGYVLNEEGEVVGVHDGVYFFTIGERHGFNITDKRYKTTPVYVISKDLNKNTITVSPNQLALNSTNTEIRCKNPNWINMEPKEDKYYTCQIRYHGELLKCSIKFEKDNNILVLFNKPIYVDSGQSIVFYDKDICLGGVIVG